MNPLELTNVPVAKTGMLIRRPVADVFAAFVDPQVTTRFWFTEPVDGSGDASRRNKTSIGRPKKGWPDGPGMR